MKSRKEPALGSGRLWSLKKVLFGERAEGAVADPPRYVVRQGGGRLPRTPRMDTRGPQGCRTIRFGGSEAQRRQLWGEIAAAEGRKRLLVSQGHSRGTVRAQSGVSKILGPPRNARPA